MSVAQKVSAEFRVLFGANPSFLARAPGRVNLIGEHTDYNDGFVMPIAIDRAIWIAFRARPDSLVVIDSLDFGERIEFDLGNMRKGSSEWIEYIKAMAWSLQDSGRKLRGWEGVVAGDIPIGAGLSSSAAMEIAAGRAFVAVAGFPWDPLAMAKLAQRAENQWIGVSCGIMDQTVSAAGQENHALLIDCRSLQIQPVPLPPQTAAVVLDTTTRRGLVDSAYNERRAQCETAARFFKVPALRDVTPSSFEARAHELDALTRRRARHVITENERTLKAAEAMRRGDAVELGQLMDRSHESLKDDFEVSSTALDIIVECAHRHANCFGARMTGAGFGGCGVALVEAGATSAFVKAVVQWYHQATGEKPNIYVCQASRGAEVQTVPGGN